MTPSDAPTSRPDPAGTGPGPDIAQNPRPLDASGAAAAVLEANDTGERALSLLVLDGPEGWTGLRSVVARSTTRGLPPGEVGEALGDWAQARLEASRGPGVERSPGAEEVVVGGITLRLYAELHRPAPELVLVGAGHIARPMATVGDLLGYRVLVLDDRPDFATRERFPTAARVVRCDFADPFAETPIHRESHLVLATRGHKYDYEALRRVLLQPELPAYVGMIGSRRRVRATWARLLEEGIPREKIAAVRAPVGLDIRAETPAEIAVAIAAELVGLERGGSSRPLREVERALERFFPQDESEEAR